MVCFHSRCVQQTMKRKLPIQSTLGQKKSRVLMNDRSHCYTKPISYALHLNFDQSPGEGTTKWTNTGLRGPSTTIEWPRFQTDRVYHYQINQQFISDVVRQCHQSSRTGTMLMLALTRWIRQSDCTEIARQKLDLLVVSCLPRAKETFAVCQTKKFLFCQTVAEAQQQLLFLELQTLRPWAALVKWRRLVYDVSSDERQTEMMSSLSRHWVPPSFSMIKLIETWLCSTIFTPEGRPDGRLFDKIFQDDDELRVSWDRVEQQHIAYDTKERFLMYIRDASLRLLARYGMSIPVTFVMSRQRSASTLFGCIALSTTLDNQLIGTVYIPPPQLIDQETCHPQFHHNYVEVLLSMGVGTNLVINPHSTGRTQLQLMRGNSNSQTLFAGHSKVHFTTEQALDWIAVHDEGQHFHVPSHIIRIIGSYLL